MKILSSVVSALLSAITVLLSVFPSIQTIENAYTYNDRNEPVMSFMSPQDESPSALGGEILMKSKTIRSVPNGLPF